MEVLTHVLKPDTQAILLLCAGFGQTRQTDIKPLSLTEYNSLAQKLQQHQLRPESLLSPDRERWILNEVDEKVGSERVLRLLDRGAMLAIAVEDWTSKGLWIVGRSDETYPQRLKQKLKHLAPSILYGIGNLDLLSKGGLAIVGSRKIGQDTLEYTQRIAEKCAEQNIQIISGGARGVDQTAMLAAVATGGTSVGILADSLIKAAVSKQYREGLREHRIALVSPYDPSAGFHIGNAMGRNKYVYALADHSLIVTCSNGEGGTWAGAKEELKKDDSIPVWVNLEDDVTDGNHQLVKLGGIPFPAQPWNRNILSLLQEAQELHSIEEQKNASTQLNLIEIKQPDTLSKITYVKIPGGEPKLPKDAYEAILPLFRYHLNEPKKDNDIAKLLDVRVEQMRSWLKKGVTDNVLQKKKDGYVLSEQLGLLDLSVGNDIQIPKDAYEAVLPLLHHYFSEPRTEEDFVELLGVSKMQVKRWLGKALKENNIMKKTIYCMAM
jgi:predicted Rossmann fold nucleotide-binding protein DprA/Smf involved in DNA uptake